MRRLVTVHAPLLAFYAAGALLFLGEETPGAFSFPLLVGGLVLAVRGASLAGNRPFLAAAPGAFAFLGASLFAEAPVLSALAAAMAVGLTAEAAAEVARPLPAGKERGPGR